MKKYEVSILKKNKTVSNGKNILILAFLIFGFIAIYLYPGVGDLPSIQAMWDKTIEYHKQSLMDTAAMQQIWLDRCPQATPDDLAKMFGAVYASTYWVQTKMDPDILSSNMQKATGMSKDVCDSAAKAAFSQWCGILTRKNSTDTGIIPNTGQYNKSYDVVCNGSVKLSKEILLKQWNNFFGSDPQVGKNYCYTRCANLGFHGKIKKAKARMFSSDAGFNIPPTSWQILYTEDNKIYLPMETMDKKPLKIGDRAASDAFIFEPFGSGPFNMITAVSTEFFRNDPLMMSGNWDSVEWINNNGAAALNNTNVNKTTESKLKFYNQDGKSERFAFEAHCIDVPPGTVISLKCRNPKVPALDSGPVKIHKKYQLISIEAEVPANFNSYLIVRIKGPGGKLLPAGASVDVRMVWLLEHGHKHYIQAADMLNAYDAARVSQEIRVPMGNFTFLGAGPAQNEKRHGYQCLENLFYLAVAAATGHQDLENSHPKAPTGS